MPNFPIVNVQNLPQNGQTYASPASVAASVQLQVGQGSLDGMLVTTSGGGTVTVYDNSTVTAGGTIVGIFANAAAQGAVQAPFGGVHIKNGLLVVTSASSPAVTIFFSGAPPT